MGKGCSLNIINGTPYTWTRIQSHSYQMNSWNLNQSIGPNQLAETYVEWAETFGKTWSDDAGEATFQMGGINAQFQIWARYGDAPQLKLHLSGMSTLSQSQGDTIDVPFVWNRTQYPAFNKSTIIISGTNGNFVCNSSNELRKPWMSNNLAALGGLNLRQLCLPASHDSGMSIIGNKTFFANADNCQTQTKGIFDQLSYGIRIFDIRPCKSSGDYYCGHYSNTGNSTIKWQGANGQKITDVVNDINRYAANNPELIILQISHAYDTDGTYSDLDQSQWNQVFGQLAQIKNTWTPPSGMDGDLSKLSLNTFIGNGQPAVIMVFDFTSSQFTLGNYADKGFFYSTQFPWYDQYKDTNDPNTLINDQLTKLKAQHPNSSAINFCLDFSLTQQAENTVLGPSILTFADCMNPYLPSSLIPNYSGECHPNQISMNKIQDMMPLAVATAINTAMRH